MTPTRWERADIVAAIHKRKTSLAELARTNGLSDSALRVALYYPRTPSNRIVADFLGISLHALWPHWFDDQGRLKAPIAKPIPTRQRKATRGRHASSSQKRVPKLSQAGRRA